MFDSVSYEKVSHSEHISSCVLQATNQKQTLTLSLSCSHLGCLSFTHAECNTQRRGVQERSDCVSDKVQRQQHREGRSVEQLFTGTTFSVHEELLNINYTSFTTLSLLFQFTKPSIDVAQMMNTWTVQKGFPLVTVSRTGNQVKVTQDHFLLNAGKITEHRYFMICFWPGVQFAQSSLTLQPYVFSPDFLLKSGFGSWSHYLFNVVNI